MKSATNMTEILDHPWYLIASLFWKRYPNPHSKHVLSEDVLERIILPNGQLYTKRIIVKASLSSIPRWIRYFTGSKKEVILEESILDTDNKSIETVTRNIGTLTKYASLFERCYYTPTSKQSSSSSALPASKNGPNEPTIANSSQQKQATSLSLSSTMISKSAWVESNWKSRLLGPLTSFILFAYSKQAVGATKGYDWVCRTALEMQTSEIALSVRLANRLRLSATAMKDKAKIAKDIAKERMLAQASSRSH